MEKSFRIIERFWGSCVSCRLLPAFLAKPAGTLPGALSLTINKRQYKYKRKISGAKLTLTQTGKKCIIKIARSLKQARGSNIVNIQNALVALNVSTTSGDKMSFHFKIALPVMLAAPSLLTGGTVSLWHRFEAKFESEAIYRNPLYDVEQFVVHFQAPSGRVHDIRGFWDGGTVWKVRFCPDETGTWRYNTECSDRDNRGLNDRRGAFECVPPERDKRPIYRHGVLQHPPGCYHLAHADGTPFFWTACTAWNGALLSTEAEWDHYLSDRVDKGYSVIQFVTTQWRGCERNRLGQVAYKGCGRISINPEFYQALDHKIGRINDYGLVAAPVLLWALQWAEGRELSPGYSLPQEEAILLARYMVARYGGHHVVWILGGDGRYLAPYEERWKTIGRSVFGESHPNLVAQHPHGRSWIGTAYRDEEWLDIVGYQSSHSKAQPTVDWITRGPIAGEWKRLPPKPIINLEPCYEEIRFIITAADVRNACYWSLLAAPISGITYGANGIWPWLHEGEPILNHRHEPGTSPWHVCIDFPGSVQVGHLASFFRSLPWWQFRPAPELLAEQPGDSVYNRFISVARTPDRGMILVYTPVSQKIVLYDPGATFNRGEWFDPVSAERRKAELNRVGKVIVMVPESDHDMVLLLSAGP